MKRTFEVEWPDDCGPMWINRDNLLLCLTNTCRNAEFTVRDVTADGCCCKPASGGPVGSRREVLLGAIARGWCSPENASKEMDVTLASAIADQVEAVI